jgi:hypothetical protein
MMSRPSLSPSFLTAHRESSSGRTGTSQLASPWTQLTGTIFGTRVAPLLLRPPGREGMIDT